MKRFVEKIFARFFGFTLVGIGITFFSMFLLYALAEWLILDINLAYVIAYAVSVQLSFFFNFRYVFHASLSWRNLFYFNLTYLAGMLVGIGVLNLFMLWAPAVNRTLLGYAVIPVTTAFNFVFVNIIAQKNEKGSAK